MVPDMFHVYNVNCVDVARDVARDAARDASRAYNHDFETHKNNVTNNNA